MKKAVLVVDMINDFVYDKFGSERAEQIIPNIVKLLKNAEKSDIPIIFARDYHSEDDPEMDIWGEHAMQNEEGSEIIEELKDFVEELVKKSTYNSFFRTDLNDILEEKEIDKIILTGVSTDICVQHTAGAAFFRGYDVVVLEDCTEAISEEKHETAIEYMKDMYGVDISNSKEIIKKWNE